MSIFKIEDQLIFGMVCCSGVEVRQIHHRTCSYSISVLTGIQSFQEISCMLNHIFFQPTPVRLFSQIWMRVMLANFKPACLALQVFTSQA